jgi:hypothetical protein
MANINLQITIKDVDNKIDKIIALLDIAFPDRDVNNFSKTEWVEECLEQYAKERIIEAKRISAQNANRLIIDAEITNDLLPAFD